MPPVAPWSVKGIDPRARALAKSAARREGMTLGEWLNRVILDDGSHFAVDLTKPPEERVTKLDSPTLLACVHQTLEACDGICLDNEDEREIVNQKLTAAIFGDKPSTSAGLMRKHLRGGEAYVEQVRRMSMSATHRRWGMDLKRTHGELLKHQNWHGYSR